MAYYMIQAMQSYQYKADDAFMRIHAKVSSSIYLNNDNQLVALVYNSSDASESITLAIADESEKRFTVPANSFSTINLD
jgi:hypothetical protein